MDNKINRNTGNNSDSDGTPQLLRCINIDCIFNSSNQYQGARNTCNHPKVAVESRFADITVAICSEFRSKKDYLFEKPSTIVDLKTREKTEIVHTPEIGITPIEKVTTEELAKSVSFKDEKHPESEIVVPVVKPRIIETKPEFVDELPIAERYNLTDNPRNDFLILKRLYQPYTKKSFIISVIIHISLLFIIWGLITPKDEQNGSNLQRIVVVEDLEMPKFDPPDIDKIKEEEAREEEKEKTEVRPNIIPKKITPRINRPNTLDDTDTSKPVTQDTGVVRTDTSLTQRDTTRFFIPDSLRTTFSEGEVGLNIGYDKTEWNLIDSRTINSNKNFTGVILGIDSTKEDFKAVTIIVNLDDPEHSAFNKATYKNVFEMDDSTVIGYVTDQQKLSAKKIQYKYFLFTDPTGKKNIQVSAEFRDEEILKKYQAKVDAIVRTIKIAVPPPKTEN